MTVANTQPYPHSGVQTVSEGPYLTVRMSYAFEPGKDESARRAIADILMRPCFAPLERAAWQNDHGRETGHTTMTHSVIEAYLGNPECDMLKMDSGRHREPIAVVNVWTGWTDLSYQGKGGLTAVAPWITTIVLPHDPELIRARVQACCELARVLHALTGAISSESTFGHAHSFALGFHPSPLAQALLQPGMSEQRVREQDCHAGMLETLDREIGGPEWAMFLGREHLRRLPLERIAASGVFARAERLDENLAYLQLTEDPLDALRDDYDDMLDRAREVLAPIQADLSNVQVE
jgi:hypothetical protein